MIVERSVIIEIRRRFDRHTLQRNTSNPNTRRINSGHR